MHTVVRLPNDVFAPYTNIQTNLLFFEKGSPTKETWFYRVDKPEGYKHFSKTKPILLEHFKDVIEWWDNRRKIDDADGNEKAVCVSVNDIKNVDYDLDRCGYPEVEEEIFDPFTTIDNYETEKARINNKIEGVLSKIKEILNEK